MQEALAVSRVNVTAPRLVTSDAVNGLVISTLVVGGGSLTGLAAVPDLV